MVNSDVPNLVSVHLPIPTVEQRIIWRLQGASRPSGGKARHQTFPINRSRKISLQSGNLVLLFQRNPKDSPVHCNFFNKTLKLFENATSGDLAFLPAGTPLQKKKWVVLSIYCPNVKYVQYVWQKMKYRSTWRFPAMEGTPNHHPFLHRFSIVNQWRITILGHLTR